MDRSTYEVRLAYWTEIVKTANNRPEGQSVRAWLKENNISKDQYYYWHRKVRDEAYQTINKQLPSARPLDNRDIAFVEFPVTDICDINNNDPEYKPDAVIKKEGLLLELSNSISERLLSACLEVISRA